MIKVCMSASQSIQDKVPIVLTSLFARHPNAFVYLFLQQDDFPYMKKDNIKVINVTKLDLDISEQNPNLTNRNTYMTFIRLYFPLILKEEDKVLYLDCDVIINGYLDDLWNIDLKDNYIAAVPEYKKPRAEKDWNYNEPYVNVGVCLMNLKLLRESWTVYQLIDFINSFRLMCADQDAFNYICRGHIMLLPYKYNSNVYTNISSTPIIIHGTPMKPWINREDNYLYPIWQYYEEMYKNEYSIENHGEDKNEE